ncbi:MAG: SPASM domain-containing protein [Vulcanimicrobiota bacterium]
MSEKEIESLKPEDNVREKSLKNIWETGRPFQKLRNIRTPRKCRDCEYYLPCRGGCRAQAQHYTMPDVYCIKELELEDLIEP